jgi:hypothetical protein
LTPILAPAPSLARLGKASSMFFALSKNIKELKWKIEQILSPEMLLQTT